VQLAPETEANATVKLYFELYIKVMNFLKLTLK